MAHATNNDLTAAQAATLTRVSRVLAMIADATALPSGRDRSGKASRLSLDQVRSLLFVACHPMSLVREVADGTDQPVTSVSRQLLDLSVRSRSLNPGWDLIEPVTSATDMRERRYRLSLKGSALIGAALKELRVA